MPSELSTDIVIVGAGVAGLWLNARLRALGYSTVLVENARLGGGQTFKAQGIIHGGAKYALHGALTGASEAIADMPRRWREALAGQGELDLSGVRLLSEAHYLWSPGTLAGNLTSFFASKAVRGRVDQVKGEQLPPALQDRAFKGKVYRLAELVVDVPSLVARLAELAGDGLLAGERIEPLYDQNRLAGLIVDGRVIRAQRVVLSAGEGIQALLAELGVEQPTMQRRPLHMVLAKGANLKPLYAHCLGGGPKPRITVTHPSGSRRPMGLVPGWRDRRSRRCGSRSGAADRRCPEGNRPTAAVGRSKPAALGHLAGQSRRARSIRAGASGQCVSGRSTRLAGGLANQAGPGAGFRRPRHRCLAARWHCTAQRCSPARAAQAGPGHTCLG